MIDIHTHLLAGVDDGTASRTESLQLLDAYADAGFTHIASTPHLFHPTVKTRVDLIREEFLFLRGEAKSRGIELVLGSEIYVSDPRPKPGIPMFKTFQLVEFNTDIRPMYLSDMVFHLNLLGIDVIIAHIDRYSWFSVKDPMIQRVREMGVYFQVNIESLESQKGKTFLENGFADFIASDNHGSQRKSVDLRTFSKYPDIMKRSMSILMGSEQH